MKHGVLGGLLAISLASPIHGQSVEPSATLEPGSVYERNLASEPRQAWRLELQAAQYGEVEVLAADAWIVLRLIDPEGVQSAQWELKFEPSPMKLRWIADVGGTWLLEVSAVEGSHLGRYSLRWADSRVAAEKDGWAVEADRLREEGDRLAAKGDYAESEALLRKSLELFERALGPDDSEVAATANNLAAVYYHQGRYEEVIPLFERALEIWSNTLGPEDPLVGTTLNNLALLNYRQGRYEEAEARALRALEIRERALGPEHLQVATTLNNLALLYDRQGRYREAEPHYRRALAIREKALGSFHGEVAASLNNLAHLYQSQGRYEEVEPLYRRAIAIWEKVAGPEHPALASGLNNLAILYSLQGRYGDAEPILLRALAMREKSLGPEHPSVAGTLNNLADLRREQGRYDEVESPYRRALAIWEKSLGPEHPRVASALHSLGLFHQSRSEYDRAEPLHLRALSIRKKALGPEHPEVAASLNSLALLHRSQNRPDPAESLHQQALSILEKALGPENPRLADSLIGLADVADSRGESETAIKLLDRAIRILDATSGFPARRIEAYAARARILKVQGRLDQALEDLKEALLAAEEMRPQTGGGEATRADFFQRYADEFSRMVAWQLEAGDLEAALEFAERGRARVLLDQLQAGRIDLRSGIPDEIRKGLEERESGVRARLTEYQNRINLMRTRTDLSDTERGGRVASLSKEREAAHREFSRIYADIKNASPLWRDLITSGGEPVQLRQIQRTLVPEGGLLLLYQLGPSVSHLFVVGAGRREVQAFPLTVDEQVGRLLGISPGPLTSESLRRALGSDVGAFFGLSGMMSPLREQLHALWRVLAPKDVWSRLTEASEVVLVPDGSLRNFPFEALVVAPADDWAATRFWLDEGPAIRYAPSATALYNIERRPSPPAMLEGGTAILLSLADPIYDPSAPEVNETNSRSSGRPTRDVDTRAGGPLARLPGTALESDAVVSHFGGEQAVSLRGMNATETNLRQALAGKRYLHLATHGLVDERRGGLFAALALAPPSEAVQAENDGILELHEIYALKLEETELAVLSACETNVGPEVEGEGVFALSRGFLAAGVRRVIASHWAVDDASTAELMGTAFAGIAEAERNGLRPYYADALREAKRHLRGQLRWSAPYFWAPFTLTGKR